VVHFWIGVAFFYTACGLKCAQFIVESIERAKSALGEQMSASRYLAAGTVLAALGLAVIWPVSAVLIIYFRRRHHQEEERELTPSSVPQDSRLVGYRCGRCREHFPTTWPCLLTLDLTPDPREGKPLPGVVRSYTLCDSCAGSVAEEFSLVFEESAGHGQENDACK